MSTLASFAPPAHSHVDLHDRFLAILPKVQTHGRIYFRHIRCPHKKADALQEMQALAWNWFMRLTRRGKDAGEFVTAFASFLARAFKDGRRLCGREKTRDLTCQRRRLGHRIMVIRLSEVDAPSAVDQALADNTQTPIPDQVSFRIDFPDWRRTRTLRDRQIIDNLLVGERTDAVAKRFGISPARVAQLRRQYHDDWMTFLEGHSPSRADHQLGLRFASPAACSRTPA